MTRKFDHLGDVEAFICVVEQGTVSAAAVTLATTASVLSRALTRLESRLGVQLLRRTTRTLSLTDAGRLYLEQARLAFTLIEEAERTIRGQEGELSGRVRMSVPTTYGHHRLPPLLSAFARQYPAVQVELGITNRNVDLIAEAYDLAIRLGTLPDSGLVGRKLEDARLSLVASPDYLALAGVPETLDDLKQHVCLPFIMPSSGKIGPWLFSLDGEEVEWVPQGNVVVSDDVLGTVSLAQSGLGICQSYDFIIRDRVLRGDLVEILVQFCGRSRPFSMIYAPHRQLSVASRALIDFLVANTHQAAPH